MKSLLACVLCLVASVACGQGMAPLPPMPPPPPPQETTASVLAASPNGVEEQHSNVSTHTVRPLPPPWQQAYQNPVYQQPVYQSQPYGYGYQPYQGYSGYYQQPYQGYQ